MNSDKKHSENLGKITLTGYYENLPERQFVAPKKEFIKELARECLRPFCVMHSYAKGHSRPKGLTAAKIKEILAKKTGVAPENIEL
jgi:hypothetical protein